MAWRVPVPSKGGKFVGLGVVIQVHHGTFWVSMKKGRYGNAHSHIVNLQPALP